MWRHRCLSLSLLLFIFVVTPLSSHQLQEQERYTFPHLSLSAFLKKLEEWRRVHRVQSQKTPAPIQGRQLAQAQAACPSLHTNSTTSSPLPQKHLVLFRVHKPTRSRIARIREHIASMSPDYDVWISVDTTLLSPSAIKAYLPLTTIPALSVKIHSYNDSRLLDAFPALLQLTDRLPPFFFSYRVSGYDGEDDAPLDRDSGGKALQWTWARAFHLEAIALWWIEAGIPERRYGNVWIIEDDVGVTGKGGLGAFFKIFDLPASKGGRAITADLVTRGRYQTSFSTDKAWRDRWSFHDSVSDPLAAVISERLQSFTQEHVQRFSMRALASLIRFVSPPLSLHGQSEMTSITLLETLCPTTTTTQLLPSALIGDGGDGYLVLKGFSKTPWGKLKRDHSKDGVPKLWHALKWD